MHLAPIEEPSGWLLRLSYFVSRRQFGKVITPMQVIYARLPEIVPGQAMLFRVVETALSLDSELRFLVEARVSVMNGCSFCADLHQAMGLSGQVEGRRFREVHRFRESGLFSESERAALEYAEAVVVGDGVSEDVFEGFRAHFSERQVVELTWLVSFTQYLNTMAVALGIESDGICALMHPSASVEEEKMLAEGVL